MADTPNRRTDSPDDYFDRLDEAFSTLSGVSRPRPPETSGTPPSPGPSLIAETFAALLALEEGTPGAKPVRLVSNDSEPKITEALLEELTRRVVQRLAPDAVRAVVVDVVSEVAERLVREEIERIRKAPHV